MVKTKKTTKKVAIRKYKKKGGKIIVAKKEKEFKAFMLWLTLPAVFLGKPDNYLETIGVVDEEAKEMMKIKNLTQFAEKYKVTPATLTDWKKKITTEQMVNNTKDYFKKLSKNIYGAFYHATIKHGDAQRVRLWEEMFNEKKAEGSDGVLPPLLGTQFNQVIINLQGEYNSKLKDEYEKQIRGKLSGTKREHSDSAD